jgi:hypothetical protein
VKGIVEYVEELLAAIVFGIAVCVACDALFVKGILVYVEEKTFDDIRFVKVNDDVAVWE